MHAEAPSAADTDWREIVGLYDLLLRITPSPVVALNRTVALAMRDGPEAGLAALDELLGEGVLDGYQLAHAARADFCRRLGRHAEAREAYQRAIKLTAQAPRQAISGEAARRTARVIRRLFHGAVENLQRRSTTS